MLSALAKLQSKGSSICYQWRESLVVLSWSSKDSKWPSPSCAETQNYEIGQVTSPESTGHVECKQTVSHACATSKVAGE